MKMKLINKSTAFVSVLSMLSVMIVAESDSFAAGRGKASSTRSGSRTIIRRATTTSVGTITPTTSEEKDCKSSYVDCMDALIPYIVERNEFLKKDKTTRKFLSNDNELRCVYDDSQIDINGTVINTTEALSANSFGKASISTGAGSNLSRMATLFRNYNYYCDETSDAQSDAKCTYDKDAASKHYAASTSSAYYGALDDQIENGNLNLANFSSGILQDLGVNVEGAKKSAKDKNGKDTDYGFAVTVAPPSFALDAAGEYATAHEICMSGKSVDELKKKRLLSSVMTGSGLGLSYLAEKIDILSEDECQDSEMLSNVQNYYKFGKWEEDKEKQCKDKGHTWDADTEYCWIDKNAGKKFYDFTGELVDENYMTPKKSCDQYEIALQSHRLEMKSSVQAKLVARSKEIEAELKKKELANLTEEAELNNEIAQMQNSFFKSCTETFNDCMSLSCGTDDVYGGAYSGCVDFNGPKAEKLLSGGMMCYPEYKICVENIARTVNKDRVSPYLQEWLRTLNDQEYQKMAIDIIAGNIGQVYTDMLEQSCEESGGFFENQFCFVKAMLKASSSYTKNKRKSGGILGGFAGGRKSTSETNSENFKSEYMVFPGIALECKDKSVSKSKKNAGGLGNFGSWSVVGGGSKGGSNKTENFTVDLIKNVDGVEDVSDGCGELFYPDNWGNYISYLYTNDTRYGIDGESLIEDNKLNIYSEVKYCKDGNCDSLDKRRGITVNMQDLTFYKKGKDGQYVVTPKSFMMEKTKTVIGGKDGVAGTGDDAWGAIFKDQK